MEGMGVCTWEEIKVQLLEVSSALRKRLERKEEVAAADKKLSSFPTLGKSGAGRTSGRCLLGGEGSVHGGQAQGPGCGGFGDVCCPHLLLSVSSQLHCVWQRDVWACRAKSSPRKGQDMQRGRRRSGKELLTWRRQHKAVLCQGCLPTAPAARGDCWREQ